MDERQGAGDGGVVQILIIRRHLMRQQQALVDDRVGRKTGDIEILATVDGRIAHRVLDALADDVELALELPFVEHVAGNENLAHERLCPPGHLADGITLDRHVPPAQQPRAFLPHDGGEQLLALLAGVGLGRKKDHADPIFTGAGQIDADVPGGTLQKVMGHLKQDARSVARAGIAALRAAMGEVLQDLQALPDDVMGALPLDVNDESDAARVLFLRGIVQTLLWGQPGYRHHG